MEIRIEFRQTQYSWRLDKDITNRQTDNQQKDAPRIFEMELLTNLRSGECLWRLIATVGSCLIALIVRTVVFSIDSIS